MTKVLEIDKVNIYSKSTENSKFGIICTFFVCSLLLLRTRFCKLISEFWNKHNTNNLAIKMQEIINYGISHLTNILRHEISQIWSMNFVGLFRNSFLFLLRSNALELSCTWHCKLVENVIFDSGIVKQKLDICVKLLGSIETDNILLGTAEDRSWNICAHEAILVHWKEN